MEDINKMLNGAFLIISVLKIVRNRPDVFKNKYNTNVSGLTKNDLIAYLKESNIELDNDELSVILDCAFKRGLIAVETLYKDLAKSKIDKEIYSLG